MVENGLVFGVVAVVTIVVAGLFSKKLGVAAPLILILVGFGFSYIPGAPTVVPHEIVLLGLLPPILYAAAINVPVVDLRRNFSTISALSVGLVLVTAFGTGVILYLIFPDLTLAGGIALGAVISPTDAVAATALGKKLGLPPRLVTILEGESLVNDATALVLLRSAIVAIGGAVSFWDVIGDFAYAVALALVIGLLVGFVTVWARSKLRDPVLDTAISLAVPFIAFIPAETLGASGVLAVVAAGLYSGHNSAKRFSAQARISEKLNWRTVQFMLENGVFLLMGVEISAIIADVLDKDLSVRAAVEYGLLMALVIVVIRFLFIGPLLLVLRRRGDQAEERQSQFRAMLDRLRGRAEGDPQLRRRQDRAERIFQRRQGDLKQLKAEGFGWRGGIILSWSGMRGVVTLAAAQSLPEEIPYRSQLILIAFTVAVVTLLVQGGTLPWLIKVSGIRGSDRVADRRELAELLDEMSAAGLAVLENPTFTLPKGEPVDEQVIERVRHDTLLSAESAWERANYGGGSAGIAKSPHQQYRTLRQEVLQAEREALLEARSTGSYPSRILGRAQAMLDLEETRLEQIDNPSGS
ncbi:CPA1 family monovalent cation:H+ antiporter [Conyzicola lurida]|uniref:CPA1 family monovalent cation:H+ antiporter n=1 Tax=Conyzicola lurida TaxID=1172621 RepID=A0A841AQG4_9MICO|nr:sodium:proton antiporter [Conyzicola lurida]MBB5843833.1 CPA1 family monovalent cation:H+ antiporter [Conyzicola lurida]